MEEFKNFDYPIDKSLKICEEKNFFEASAFLYEKSGDFNKALDLHINV